MWPYFPPPFLSALNICRQKPLTSKCGSTVLQSRWVSPMSYCSCLDNYTTGLDNCTTGLATRRSCTSRRLETIYFRITIAIAPWDVDQEISLNYSGFTAPQGRVDMKLELLKSVNASHSVCVYPPST